MFDLTGFGRRVCFGLKTPQSAAIVIAALAAGCSADVTRFDSANFNLNDPPEAAAQSTPPESVRAHSDYPSAVTHSTPRGPYGAGAGSVDVAALPEPAPSAPVARPYPENSWQKSPTGAPSEHTAPSYAAASADTHTPAAASHSSGETIEVKTGDTLYGLSKRHGVSLAELMSANGLTSPNLKPGQKLLLPSANAPVRSAPRKAVAAAPATLSPASPETAARYGSTYTVQPGDSLYKIARANKVNFAELQHVNGITDPRKVMPGTVLKIPGASSVATASTTPSLPPAAVAEAEPATQSAPMASNTTTQPTVINAGKQVAALNDTATDAAPAAPKSDQVANAEPQAQSQAQSQVGDSSKLRWPVSGRVIAGFGGRPDGTHNDGINLSVPLGTDVHAAEAGVVAYSGSELKGYGNLVLLRHDNGWVTAYAHNDELLVKRGDKVRRGQVIGKAGKTGTVDQPQVHFELRQGSKPVDPTPFMEKL